MNIYGKYKILELQYGKAVETIHGFNIVTRRICQLDFKVMFCLNKGTIKN